VAQEALRECGAGPAAEHRQRLQSFFRDSAVVGACCGFIQVVRGEGDEAHDQVDGADEVRDLPSGRRRGEKQYESNSQGNRKASAGPPGILGRVPARMKIAPRTGYFAFLSHLTPCFVHLVNPFWRVLYRSGFTPELILPENGRSLLEDLTTAHAELFAVSGSE
jgi:hypothetical protein